MKQAFFDTTGMPFLTEGTLVRAFLAKLKQHPFVKNPLVMDGRGKPIPILRWRDFDGYALKTPPAVLTLAVFPYHFGNSTQATALSAGSMNAATVFRPGTLGGPAEPGSTTPTDKDMSAYVEVTTMLVFKLYLIGFEQKEVDTNAMQTAVSTDEFDENEHALRLWAPIIAAILRSDEYRKLNVTNLDPETNKLQSFSHLLNSSVKNISYDTGSWTTGPNLVFHSASLQLECHYNVPRHLSKNERWTWVEPTDGRYLELGTIPDPSDPPNTREFRYDLVEHEFVDENGNVLAEADYIDGGTGEPFAGVNQVLLSLVLAEPDLSAAQFPLFFTREASDSCGC